MKESNLGFRLFRNSRLQNQFLLAFVLICFLTLSIGSYFMYIRTLSMLQEKSEQASVRGFQLVDKSIRSFRDEVNRLSQYILTDTNVQVFLEHPNSDQVNQILVASGIRDKLTDSIGINKYVRSISIYSVNGGALGLSDSKFYTASEAVTRQALLASSAYQSARDSFPDLIWEGVNHSSDNDQIPAMIPFGDEQQNLIAAYRGIKSYYQSSVSGMLVINVAETTLANIYTAVANSQDEHTYILDRAGRTISASEKGLLDQDKSALLSKFEDEYGSFIMNTDGVRNQLVYYRLSDTGWILCREVPLSTLERDIVSLRTVLFYMIALCLVISSVFAFYITRKLLQPVTVLVKGMRTLERGQLGITLEQQPSNELGILFTQFNQMSVSLQQVVERNRVIEDQKRQAELNVLQAQINPHFLYNTLNTIKWMAISIKADNIMRSITALGNMIRPIFSGTSPIITLEEELDYTLNYFTLMNSRYGEGVKLEIHIPDDLLPIPVPRLILQPIVENGLIHGLESQKYRGIIRIEASREQNEIRIQIEDNGRGIDEEELNKIRSKLEAASVDKPLSGSGIGLSNVHIRLRLYYGEGYGLQIEPRREGGALVILRMSLVQKS